MSRVKSSSNVDSFPQLVQLRNGHTRNSQLFWVTTIPNSSSLGPTGTFLLRTVIPSRDQKEGRAGLGAPRLKDGLPQMGLG